MHLRFPSVVLCFSIWVLFFPVFRIANAAPRRTRDVSTAHRIEHVPGSVAPHTACQYRTPHRTPASSTYASTGHRIG
eukprot:2067346-Rhodomonas_salina.1